MNKFKVGDRIGKLEVIDVYLIKGKRTMAKLKCDCGNVYDTCYSNLELLKGYGCSKCYKGRVTHGMKHARIYNVWKMMKFRCSPSGDENQRRNYYDRGIRVCDEWKKFENFYKWAMNNGYSDELTIDRIDNNGNYEPSNCRWVTLRENQWNKRTTIFTNYNGKDKNLMEISKETNLNIRTLRTRLYRGKSMDDPYVEKKNEKYLYNGEYLTKRELSDKYNISLHTIVGRLNRGWSIEETMETPLLNYKKNIQLYKYNNKYYCIAELARILGLKRTTLKYRMQHGIMSFEKKKEEI